MKYIISLLIFLITSFSFAYNPSNSLVNFLDSKVVSFEEKISAQGESHRDKLISTFQRILVIAPSQNYRNIEQEKFTYIITYMKTKLEENGVKTLTINDFQKYYDGFEVVQYPSQIVATVRNKGPFGQTNDDSFQNLAGFIFGDNSNGTEIAMTSPVTRTQLDENTYESAFIMPSGWTLDSLPTPNNERVTIKRIPSSLKAVKRFSGRANKTNVDSQRSTFQDELNAAGIVRYSLPTLSQYDGPRVPGRSRRNELWVELNEVKFEF